MVGLYGHNYATADLSAFAPYYPTTLYCGGREQCNNAEYLKIKTRSIKNIYFMRNLLLVFTLLFSVVTSAQVSDVVNLSIELKAIQTIMVNPLQKNVDLVYDSQEKYESGIISKQTDHLEIFTTGGGWAVQVSGLVFDFNADVTIFADPLESGPTYEFTPTTLSQTPTDLIAGIRGGRSAFNITYDNSGGANKYIEHEKKIYTTEVTYTLMPR